MNHSSEHSDPPSHIVTPATQHDPPAALSPVSREHEVVTNVDRPPLLSWGAVFAGLLTVVSTCWMMHLLGIALGVSIADATDGDAATRGLAIGAVVWMVISSAVACFLGSMLAARLSGKVDSTVGMLHGFVLWSFATVVILVMT